MTKEKIYLPNLPEGWEVFVETYDDEFADISHLGKFTDKVDGRFHFKRGSWNERSKEMRVDRNEYRYFVPENDPREVAKESNRMGYSKGVAHEMAWANARQDWEFAENLGQTWSMVVVAATVYVHDVEMGRSSLGGVTYIWDKSGRAQLEEDKLEVAVQAVAETKVNLEKFISKVTKDNSSGNESPSIL